MTYCALRNPAVVVASGEQWSVGDCLHDVWRLGILDSSDGEENFYGQREFGQYGLLYTPAASIATCCR